jgi:hypothetical protein
MQGRGCMEDFRNFATWSIRVMRMYWGRRFFEHCRETNKLLASIGLGVGSELTARIVWCFLNADVL